MKTKVFLGSFIALTVAISAQTPWATSGTSIYNTNTGNVGIGTSSPLNPLEIQTTATGGHGILLQNISSGGGEATIRMDATIPGGRQYGIHSIGNGWGSAGPVGSFMIRDESVWPTPQPRFLIDGTTGYVGIGTITPAKKLDVTSAIANDGISITQIGSNAAGLHMDNQTSGGKHWALYSTGNSSPQGAGNFSIYDYTAGKDRLFISGTDGSIGIGTTSPAAKLHATETTNVAYSDAISVHGNSTSNSPLSQSIGVYGYASGGQAGNGVKGVSAGGLASIGGNFSAGNGQPVYGGMNVGVKGSLNDDVANINIAVFGDPMGFTNNAWAGWFSGYVYCTASYLPSDKRLKKDIKSVESSLNIIRKLNPVTYNFNTEEHNTLGLPDVKQYGFISQEVQQILPEMTKVAIAPGRYDQKTKETSPSTEILTLNYNGFFAILTKGIQEQQQLIETQQNQLADQQKQLDDQKQLIDALNQKVSGTTGINSVGGVETGFQMSQNEPNPFTHETVVKYTLPQSVSNAFMAVYDLTGKQITTFPIDQKGSSSITLTSEKLAAGIYIYSIVADGKIMDSKRMVVAGN